MSTKNSPVVAVPGRGPGQGAPAPADFRPLLARLPAEERDTVSLRFGLEHGVPRDCVEVAKALGKHPNWTRVVLARALERVRHEFAIPSDDLAA